MKRYIRSSLWETSYSRTTDPKTGKPVVYFDYTSVKSASDKCAYLKSLGFTFKQEKSFRHGWYNIYENEEEIAVVMYDDGYATFTRPYSK